VPAAAKLTSAPMTAWTWILVTAMTALWAAMLGAVAYVVVQRR